MYKHCITRISRSAVIIAIDASVSMQEWTMLYNTCMRKMEAAALIANFAIDELVMRSTRAGSMRDYFDIIVLHYSDSGIEPIIANEEGGMVHINKLHDIIPQPVSYNIVQKQEDGTYTTMPLTLNEWVRPKASGIATMYSAFVHIKELLSEWCDDTFNQSSFPPIVLHITGGCCGDAEYSELKDVAADIEALGTKDGSTLLVNIYLANEKDETQNLLFPTVCNNFSQDHDCQMLYNISSTLPRELEHMVKNVMQCNNDGPYKCFARNASICEILTLTDIGTECCNKYR